MTNDPGRLAHNLSTLSKEVTDWSHAVSAFKDDAAFTMKQGIAAIGQAEHQGKITENQFADDQDLLKRANDTLSNTSHRCKEAEMLAQHTLAQSQAALTKANDTLDHWIKELKAAKEWLERALQRLDTARAELKRALENLAYAISALRSAERSLNSCANDNNRKNCRGEEAAVYRAQSMVNTAQQQVRAAEKEVRAAEEEVAQARAKVEACTKAVGFATDAVDLAKSTLQTAQQGVNHAERSLEYVEAARKALVEAQSALGIEEEAVTAMKAAIKEGKALVDEAQQHLKNAEYYEASVQRVALGTTHKLEEKIEQLWRIDRPDLVDGLKMIIPNAIVAGILTLNALTSQSTPPPPPLHTPIAHETHRRPEDHSPWEDLETFLDEARKGFEEQDDILDRIRHPSDPPKQ